MNSIISELEYQFNGNDEEEDEHKVIEMTKVREENLIIESDDQQAKRLPRYSCCIHKAHTAIKKAAEKIP